MTAFILKPYMQRWYRAARSGGAFHPTQLPGLVALYDISDLSTLFVERTGASASTPASVDGVVGTVLDLSGKGNHYIAGSDAARGLMRFDDGHYLALDGTDDFYDAPALLPTSEMTFVAKYRSERAASQVMWGSNDPNRRSYIGAEGVAYGGVGTLSPTTLRGEEDVTDETGITALAFNSNEVNLYWNGEVIFSSPISDFSLNTRSLYLGALHDNTPQFFWLGRFYGGAIYSNYLDIDDILRLTDYFNRNV